MLLGAAAAHNFGLAASPTGVTAYTPHVLVLGFAACVYIGITNKSKA
jgi:putative membrane protein